MGLKVLGTGPAAGEVVPRSYVDARTMLAVMPGSGDWALPSNVLSAAASTATVQNGVYFTCFDVGPTGLGVQALGVQLNALASGGAGITLTVGLYADRGDGSGPLLSTAGLLTQGNVDLTAASTTAPRSYTPSPNPLVLAPGRYWAATRYAYTTAPSTAPTFLCISNATTLWAQNGAGLSPTRYLYLAAQAVLPTASATLTAAGGSTAPVVGLRAA